MRREVEGHRHEHENAERQPAPHDGPQRHLVERFRTLCAQFFGRESRLRVKHRHIAAPIFAHALFNLFMTGLLMGFMH